MNELFHVIQREYMTRVRSKSFILITLLTPLFLSLLLLLPTYFATQHEDYKQIKIGLIDLVHSLDRAFDESELIVETIKNQTVENVRDLVLSDQWEGIVYIASSDSSEISVQYYSSKQPSVFLLNQIKSAIQKMVLNEKLAIYGIKNVEEMIRSIKESISIENIKIGADSAAQKASSPYQQSLCMALGLTIYLFIFLFSSQVMRGVLEEKTNRIVELIITSISPVKFMAGKIIGIALLGLTQIVCWIALLYGFTFLLSNFQDLSASGNMGNIMNQRINPDDVSQILNNLNLIDFDVIIPAFVFFFVGGYLLYASIFAAIAATANYSDDIQQVTMIVTIPLILSIIILSNTINSPDSAISYWFSIIPFTSPIVMMGRVVYGVPLQDILLSMLFLTATVAFIIWLSGKIYKTAILYSGKKIKFFEIISWLKNTNN
ncbi:ABC transporter permease [Bacteroidia bacterium]|nr:ABC transporter permease [Bacteroidia bacterium]